MLFRINTQINQPELTKSLFFTSIPFSKNSFRKLAGFEKQGYPKTT